MASARETKFFLSIVLIAASSLALPFLSLARDLKQESPEERMSSSKADPYDFSADGRSGRRTSGGSRGNCPQLDPGVTALIPIANWGRTVSGHPTWWFYIPYAPEQAPVGEFVLQDKDYNDLHREEFSLPQTPGFISVSLPKGSTELEIATSYRWQLNLYCSRDRLSVPIFVSGWIERVSPDPELVRAAEPQHRTYANYGIWFDAVGHLARRYQSDPTNAGIAWEWQNLLRAKGVELDFSEDVPLRGAVRDLP